MRTRRCISLHPETQHETDCEIDLAVRVVGWFCKEGVFDQMKIESLRVQGFKSIRDIKISALSGVNVFFGRNDVGKSNIFEALSLWSWLLVTAEEADGQIAYADLDNAFPTPFQLEGAGQIQIQVRVLVRAKDISSNGVKDSPASRLDARLRHAGLEQCVLESTVALERRADKKVAFQIRNHWKEWEDFSLSPQEVASVLPRFHRIGATRRFESERWTQRNGEQPVDHYNLKQKLFYAYLSSDFQQKKRLEAIQRILAQEPFALGTLDIALDPETNRIDIGFIRPQGRLPLENLGSGSQQLLLILGQLFLGDYAWVALEEPEMNLSPFYQEHLLGVLRRLMQDPSVSLTQLFISTHSPYLEFTENFYDVFLDENNNTRVVLADDRRRSAFFALTPTGPDTQARLNSLNQVKLYDALVADLGLKRGDLVLFVKNEDTGHWEIRSATEVAQELQSHIQQ
ncbi:MAG: hypothetical protein D6694_11415 [Gammaproteobacteria bacterium]|nr:MAG: hypothetical protein D6694_11415 [Gammaproteobacteria bacterium]